MTIFGCYKRVEYTYRKLYKNHAFVNHRCCFITIPTKLTTYYFSFLFFLFLEGKMKRKKKIFFFFKGKVVFEYIVGHKKKENKANFQF